MMVVDPVGLVGALVVLGLLLMTLRVVVGNVGRGLPGRPMSSGTATEIVLSIFAVANLLTSPSASLIDPTVLAVGMAVLVVGLALRPRSGGAIALVGVTAAVLDLALDRPQAVVPIAVIALLLGVLFAQTRVLTRGIARRAR